MIDNGARQRQLATAALMRDEKIALADAGLASAMSDIARAGLKGTARVLAEEEAGQLHQRRLQAADAQYSKSVAMILTGGRSS